jgi:hypothetical protein
VHGPLGEQGQYRRSHVTAPGPRSAAPATSVAEAAAAGELAQVLVLDVPWMVFVMHECLSIDM